MLINITNTCQAFNCLPSPGGLLDQDSYLVHGMQLVLEAQAERQKMDQEKAERKAKASSGRKR